MTPLELLTFKNDRKIDEPTENIKLQTIRHIEPSDDE